MSFKEKITNIFSPKSSRKIRTGILRGASLGLAPLAYLSNQVISWRAKLDFKRKLLEFPVGQDDIFIANYPRSGTTWMQMILLQLTTDGNMKFNHISERIPHLDRVLSLGLNISHLPALRVFKTHLSYKEIPKKTCKYIYSVRDGRDVAVSYFHHYKNPVGFRGDFSHFFSKFMAGQFGVGGLWFKHVSEWYRNSWGLDILYVTYEEMKKDLPGIIRRTAQFCGLPIAENNLDSLVERCEFSFMKKHERYFEHITELIVERGVKYGYFIRKGTTGDWTSYFNPDKEKRFAMEFQKWLSFNKNIPLYVTQKNG